MPSPLSGRILAHRGLWKGGRYKPNSLEALVAAAREGFGIETDLRDFDGSVVIGHDPPSPEAASAESVLRSVLEAASSPIVLALNVKSDGLLPLLGPVLDTVGAGSSYFFDMSVPQLVVYAKNGLPVAIRVSEYEPFRPDLLDQLGGLPHRIWLDAFESDWWLGDPVVNELAMRSMITVVSPEIHGRDPIPVWKWFIDATRRGADAYLCTDESHRVLELAS